MAQLLSERDAGNGIDGAPKRETTACTWMESDGPRSIFSAEDMVSLSERDAIVSSLKGDIESDLLYSFIFEKELDFDRVPDVPRTAVLKAIPIEANRRFDWRSRRSSAAG